MSFTEKLRKLANESNDRQNKIKKNFCKKLSSYYINEILIVENLIKHVTLCATIGEYECDISYLLNNLPGYYELYEEAIKAKCEKEFNDWYELMIIKIARSFCKETEMIYCPCGSKCNKGNVHCFEHRIFVSWSCVKIIIN